MIGPKPLLAAVLLALTPLAMPAQQPLRYTLRFPEPATHYVEVELDAPTEGRKELELLMAVWTPGSYLVREYSGHVEGVHAESSSGQELEIRKITKNRWRVDTAGAEHIRFAYRVYCREMSVRSNWVERDFAVLNGASTFITVDGRDGDAVDVPHEVRLEMPEDWPLSHSGLSSRGENAYVAENFDALIDSPILAGDLAVYEFAVDDVPHYLVNLGEGGVWDGERAVRDLERIVRAEIDFWGEIPYESYSFLNAITEAGGGLEHKNSTLLMTRRMGARTRKGYVGWLYLASHEFFHAWNVKRLRPAELGPFDYENEVYTRGLWIAEGLTSYYDPLVVRRAGLTTHDEYLQELSKEIETLETTPGRLVQSVTDSSFDAWVKAYRRNENTRNTGVSYYNKGALVGFALDAAIRTLTAGDKSLDDVMRLAYRRFAGVEGFSQGQFRETVSEIAGADMSDWLQERLDKPGELDYSEALSWYGLRFKPAEEPEEGEEPQAWLGLETDTRNGQLVVKAVRRDTPAYRAGVNAGDELLAIDSYRVLPEQLEDRLEAYRPGDTLELLVARRGALVRLEAQAAEAPNEERWKLEVDPKASEEQGRRLAVWLGE